MTARRLPSGHVSSPDGPGDDGKGVVAMISCGYNGWADVPEDEREALEIWEARALPPTPAYRAPAAQPRTSGVVIFHDRTRREAA